MKKEFVIDRQGREFVLFAGLLDAAHTAGLKAIRTTLLQAPSDANGQTTIVHAEVEMGDGRVFHGIGDANPQNVGRGIIPHALRMAETRAKARALRDSLNIGAAALEELGDLDDAPPPVRAQTPARQQAPPPRQQPTPIRPTPDRPLPESADDVDWKQLGEPRDPALMAGAVTGATPIDAAEVDDTLELRQRWATLAFDAEALGLRVPTPPTNPAGLAKALDGLAGMVARAKQQQSAPSGRGGRGR